MKKLLTILLALLVVTGVVFADYPEEATLSLSSEVLGFTKHGFFAVPASNDGTTEEVTNMTIPANESNAVDLTGNNENLAYYNFYTNSSTNVSVKFELNSMYAKVNEVDWYVPYNLKIGTATEKESVGGSRLAEDSLVTTFGTANAAFNENSDNQDYIQLEAAQVFKTTGSGDWWISLPLSVEFNDTNGGIIPEGVFTGSIVAYVGAP